MTDRDPIIESSLRIDSQFPHFSRLMEKFIREVAEQSRTVVNELVGSEAVTYEQAFGEAFEESIIAASEFLNTRFTSMLISDTAMQFAEYIKEAYFTVSDKKPEDFASEALEYMKERSRKRYENGALIADNFMESVNGSAAENV